MKQLFRPPYSAILRLLLLCATYALNSTLLPTLSAKEEVNQPSQEEKETLPPLSSIKPDPIADLMALYETDQVVFSQKYGWSKWDFSLISDIGKASELSTPHQVKNPKKPFKLAKYEATAQQYCSFLNAVASSDPHQLYDTRMGSDSAVATILREGLPGSYTYRVIEGREEFPITYISWYAAARFCNWLHHGAPDRDEIEEHRLNKIEEGIEITEIGAYDLRHLEPGTIPSASKEALYFLPSEEQWDHAAFYRHHDYMATGDNMMEYNSSQCEQLQHDSYANYPTIDGDAPSNKLHDPRGANYLGTKNWFFPTNTTDAPFWRPKYHALHDRCRLTEVGHFGPQGHSCYDLAGNVAEWSGDSLSQGEDEATKATVLGGSWNSSIQELSRQASLKRFSPEEKNNTTGFRIAAVATPFSPVNPELIAEQKQTMEEFLFAVMRRQNHDFIETAPNIIAVMGGPLEFLGSFVAQESLEMFGIVATDMVINSCTRQATAEGEEVVANSSGLWRYWRVMAIPTGLDLYGGISIGGRSAWINSIQVIAHAFVDSTALRMIDLYGLEEAEAMGARYGLTPLIEFYKSLHATSEAILAPLEERLNRCLISQGLERLSTHNTCPFPHQHPAHSQTLITSESELETIYCQLCHEGPHPSSKTNKVPPLKKN